MRCKHGNFIADCPDKRCNDGGNTPDTIAEWLANNVKPTQITYDIRCDYCDEIILSGKFCSSYCEGKWNKLVNEE